MPFPSLLCLALIAGLITAFAARTELCISPRSYIATRAFRALMVYACFILIPISLYFYIFHGDWFLVYTIDTTKIPSALVLVGLLFEGFFIGLSFVAGAQLVRRQRSQIVIFLIVLLFILGASFIGVTAQRLGWNGSYAQYHGGFGLQRLGASYLLPGIILMMTIAFIGLMALVVRLNWGAKHPSRF